MYIRPIISAVVISMAPATALASIETGTYAHGRSTCEMMTLLRNEAERAKPWGSAVCSETLDEHGDLYPLVLVPDSLGRFEVGPMVLEPAGSPPARLS